MPPEKPQELRRQLQSVEVELDEFMSRDEVSRDSKERQWSPWTGIALELFEELGTDEDEMSQEIENSEGCQTARTFQNDTSEMQTVWRHMDQS